MMQEMTNSESKRLHAERLENAARLKKEREE